MGNKILNWLLLVGFIVGYIIARENNFTLYYLLIVLLVATIINYKQLKLAFAYGKYLAKTKGGKKMKKITSRSLKRKFVKTFPKRGLMGVSVMKCKYCGKQLSSSDYLGDYYGICEDGCNED